MHGADCLYLHIHSKIVTIYSFNRYTELHYGLTSSRPPGGETRNVSCGHASMHLNIINLIRNDVKKNKMDAIEA